jgi:serine/threonine protein kinase
MWSLGCIVVELFLGLPLFPGSSEYNQVSRITEMLGLPPNWMLEVGKQAGEFFEKVHDEFGRRTYRLKSMEQYSREHNTKEQPSKKYFTATRLPEIIRNYPMPRKGMKQNEIERGEFKETCAERMLLIRLQKWPIGKLSSTSYTDYSTSILSKDGRLSRHERTHS